MGYYTQAQNKATQKYNKKAYDDFKLRTKKGRKSLYMAEAERQGICFNSYVIDLIEKDIKGRNDYGNSSD